MTQESAAGTVVRGANVAGANDKLDIRLSGAVWFVLEKYRFG